MPSKHKTFWDNESFAFVGHSAKAPFPKLSYGSLKEQGKTVYPVDPSVPKIEGDATYPDLKSLPTKVDAVVLETPREETEAWVQQVVDAGISHLWIHMKWDTPEALALAEDNGIDVRTGTCAVMYVKPGLSFHSIHRFFRRISGKY